MRRISIRTLSWLSLLVLVAGCAGPKRLPPAGTGPEPAPRPGRPGDGRPVILGVGIVEEVAFLTIAATGEAWVLAGDTRKRLTRVTDKSLVLECRRAVSQVGWSLGDHRGSAASLVLEPVDPRHRVHREGREYRGDFMVRPTPEGAGLTLINNIDLENYLKGVVPWEIGRHDRDKLAAVEAQAVAARTYTMSHLGARKSRGFDLFASVMDQVYKGTSD